MYSVLIVTMMSTSPQPAFGGGGLFHRNNNDCYGCVGQSCTGCQGCWGGSGCNGCCGGGSGFLGIRSFFADLFGRGCSGCSGGCSGCFGSCSGCNGGCSGCFGSCSGCFGGYPVMSYPISSGMGCFGMPSMSGYDFGGTMIGSMPMTGMPMTGMPMTGGPILDGQYASAPVGMLPAVPGAGQYPATMPPGPIATGPMPQTFEATTPPNMATIVVTLPADARMYVDDQLMTLTGAVRTFRTPPIPTGERPKPYTIRIEYERNGRTEKETKSVELELGKVSRVHFPEPAAGASARINVRAPMGATLSVEGREFPADTREIITPVLRPDAVYTYTLKLTRSRDGKVETVSRDVTFRAGGSVTVEFGDVEPRGAERLLVRQ